MSDSEHHLDGCFWLLDLLEVIALVRGQVRQFMHPFILFVQVVVFSWSVMLVQTVNVDTDDNHLIEAVPDDVLLLVMPKQREVMGLEQSITGQSSFGLTIFVNSL